MTRIVKTPDGRSEVSHRVQADTFTGKREDKIVQFEIPEDCVRDNFDSETNVSGFSAGGYANWLTDDLKDGRVKLHVWADAPRSEATVTVRNVTAKEKS